MTNIEKYKQIFTDSLGVTEEQLEGLTFQSVPQWDSVGHMTLVASLEDAFDLMLDTDDIIGLDSFKKGLEVLARYGVAF